MAWSQRSKHTHTLSFLELEAHIIATLQQYIVLALLLVAEYLIQYNHISQGIGV